MPTPEAGERSQGSRWAQLVVAVLIAVGLAGATVGWGNAWWTGIGEHEAEGVYLGQKSKPVDPSLVDPLKALLRPKPQYRLTRLRRIPRITQGDPSPHPFVGDCRNCHLYTDGPPPGSQPITPLGSAMERISKVSKLGPPLRPDSHQPHPEAGRCIKCHDIVIKVPAKKQKNSYLWTL
jgi:hypothetical protein